MGLVRRLAAVVALCLAPLSAGAGLPETIQRVKPSVVGVGTFMALRQPRGVFLGTGFAVADGRHVVTNEHVVSAQKLDEDRRETIAVFVRRDKGEPRAIPAELVQCDKRHDLCLLRLQKGEKVPPLRLGHAADVREGERYALTGFPIGMVLGLTPVTHEGIVAAITPIAIPALSTQKFDPRMLADLSAPYDVFQLDAVAFPGNSGSPLYEADSGKVVGVVNSVFVKGSKEAALENPSGITYAIPVTHVYDLLLKAGVKP